MGMRLNMKNSNNELIILFERLVAALEIIEKKKIKQETVPSEVLFKISLMNRNTRSKLFSASAFWLDPSIAVDLLENGMVQRIDDEGREKYALTFKGIAHCVKMKYGKTFEEQFAKFVELYDSKFMATDQAGLTWKEKLATLSLILMSSTSESSAVSLTNEYNKEVLTEVFKKTLDCLKKFRLVNAKEELGTVSRGESPVSALMSRLQTLPGKTNRYYQFVGRGSIYFIAIEDNGEVDQKKMFFLLRKIFENYDPTCNYEEMNKELAEISQRYSPRFQERTIKASIMFSVLRNLEDFLDMEIRRLPEKPFKNAQIG
jgi:hypothetical protein